MNLVAVEKIARELMAIHLDAKWSFKWSNAKKTFGTCSYGRINDTVLYGTITLSKPLCLLNDETQVRDTILHEIAHALTLGHGHDNTWKRKCVEIGAKPIRCYSSDEVTRPKMKYVAICGGCQREFQKGRITRKARYSKQICKCQAGKSWDDRHILVFKERSL